MEILKTKEVVRGSYRSGYSPEDLDNASQLVVTENIPLQRAATQFGVPITTLKDRVTGRISLDRVKSGPLSMFSQEEETRLARHIIMMGGIGFGYTRRETLRLASDYVVHLGHRGREHPLSLYWLYSFMGRNLELKVQKSRKLESARARCATKEAVGNYFRELTNIMEKYHLQKSPQSIFNIDEKGLSTDVVPSKIIAGRHCKAQAVTSGKSQTVTMIGAVSASRNTVPPYFVFPGKRMREDLMEGALPGVQATVTESGWSNTEMFSTYMKSHFIRFVSQRSAESPVLVFYDGHKSHISLGLIEWARDNFIILFVLPPHTSHLLQPLGVGCYGPFESWLIAACHAHLRNTGGKVITKYDVCRLDCNVHSATMTTTNITSSFTQRRDCS